MVDRTRREFSGEDIGRIAQIYHAWRGEKEAGAYADVPGFCKAAALDEVRGHGHVLTPGRHIGSADSEGEEVPFSSRFANLKGQLEAHFTEADRLTSLIRAGLDGFSNGT
jgi:type I restriction enzyme M protein